MSASKKMLRHSEKRGQPTQSDDPNPKKPPLQTEPDISTARHLEKSEGKMMQINRKRLEEQKFQRDGIPYTV